ncbi:MAG: hypothetical protein P4L53_06445 [Candidatus Obscuribacterales bacterium]|nr:hypothetical protein [Candidatus Obscuribacterales bacterium]
MKKILTLGIALCTALILTGCAAGGNFGCDRYGCDAGVGANLGPIGGSIGAGVDRHGVSAHEGAYIY